MVARTVWTNTLTELENPGRAAPGPRGRRALAGCRRGHAAYGPRRFAVAPPLDPDLAPLGALGARNDRRLRSLGITVRETADVVIGACGLAHGHAPPRDHRDFARMEMHPGPMAP